MRNHWFVLSLIVVTLFGLSSMTHGSLRDQGQIFGTGGTLHLKTEEWSQSITTGISGQLTEIVIQFHYGVPEQPPALNLSIFDGGNPVLDSALFSEKLFITSTDLDKDNLFTWDLGSASLFFNVGDVFSFVLKADGDGYEIAGNDSPGYEGGELFMNRNLYSELSDIAFITYVIEVVTPPRIKTVGDVKPSGIGPNDTVLDPTIEIFVGGDSDGSLSISNGGTLDAGALIVGQKGMGTVVVCDADSKLLLRLAGNRMAIGDHGTGSLYIYDGAVVDATVDANVCTSSDCNNYISHGAGSTGTLTITGAGSRLDAINCLTVGGAAVWSEEHQGLHSFGELSILNGGELMTDRVIISGGPGGGIPSGDESTVGIVTVDGIGSKFTVAEGIGVAGFSNAIGILQVRNGAEVTADYISIGVGGALTGNGAIIGNVVNEGGTIFPGNSVGTLTINGALSNNKGTLEIEIAGLEPDELDQLVVSGNASLGGGKIVLSFINGFLPKQGDEISFLQAESVEAIADANFVIEGLAPSFQFSVDTTDGGVGIVADNDAAPANQSVTIDIRPYCTKNFIWPKSLGFISVAVLSTDIDDGDPADFDATQIDPASVVFGPAEAPAKYRYIYDVDGDGDLDYLFIFKIKKTGIVCGDTEAELSGETLEQTIISGTDSIQTIFCKP